MPHSSEFDLYLERTLKASRAQVWKAWTDIEIVKAWWCPKPWTTPAAEIQMRPGGRFWFDMRGPNGETGGGEGCVLEVAPMRRISWTDSLGPGWRPREGGFITAIITMEDDGAGCRYAARVLHKNAEDRAAHLNMGFEGGWGAVMQQLDEIARTL